MAENKAQRHSAAYEDAGVNIEAGYESVRRIKDDIARTRTPGVVSEIGGFAALFSPPFEGMEDPLLVSGTDGVGTKIRLAQWMDKHDTIGIDCVAMCVNDILCAGAKPLFFLDYLAVGKNEPQRVASIVSGVAEGCVQADCALIGGETAEHPGVMPPEDYDLAGFAVGIVDRPKMIRPEMVEAGDVVLALPSTGIHSNGFSLIRHIFDLEGGAWRDCPEALGGRSLGEALLAPTKIYVRPVLALLEALPEAVHGMVHVTGGGFGENLPRALPAGLGVELDFNALEIPPIFQVIQEAGNVSIHDMFNTFNMGVGFILYVPESELATVQATLEAEGQPSYPIGRVLEMEGDESLRFLNLPERLGGQHA